MQLLLQLKEHPNKKFTTNLLLNLCALGDGSDDCVFFIKKITQFSSYLYEFIPKSNHNYNTQNFDHIYPYYCRTDIFKYSFFSYTIVEWNKLNPNLKNAKCYMCFRNSLFKIGRQVPNSYFKVYSPLGINFLTILRLGLNHLNPNKAGHFEGSFFWGEGQIDPTPPSYFKKNLSNINITLYNC